MSDDSDTTTNDVVDSTNTNQMNAEPKLDAEGTNELWSSRRKMSWLALYSIVLPTLYIVGFVDNNDRLSKLGDLMSWYYLALASIVGAYFGFKAWSTIKGK